MIFDELNTSFVFYDDLDKQNRFRGNCAAVCDYSQLAPIDAILPFQILASYDTSTTVNAWLVKCKVDDSAALDLADYTDYIAVYNNPAKGTYITYEGEDLGINLSCGNYYLQVELLTDAGEFLYYSEVFTVKEGIEDPVFEQSIFPLISVWPWYDTIEKRFENTRPCNEVCPFQLICGNDALLPFEFRIPFATTINSWKIANESCELYLDIDLLDIITSGDYKIIKYNGKTIALPCGLFYGEMVIDGVTYYSEPIFITNDISTIDTDYILQETGDLILQENNFGLLQE